MAFGKRNRVFLLPLTIPPHMQKEAVPHHSSEQDVPPPGKKQMPLPLTLSKMSLPQMQNLPSQKAPPPPNGKSPFMNVIEDNKMEPNDKDTAESTSALDDVNAEALAEVSVQINEKVLQADSMQNSRGCCKTILL